MGKWGAGNAGHAAAYSGARGEVRVVGIDQSLRGTGVVVLDGYVEGDALRVKVREQKLIQVPDKGSQIDRALKISELLGEILWRADADGAAMEGYAYGGSKVLAVLVMLGTILKLACQKFYGAWPTVYPPTTLKKFVTGKGNCDKSLMLKEVFRRWGFDTGDDNVADAYGIAMMELTRRLKLKGRLPDGALTTFQVDALKGAEVTG